MKWAKAPVRVWPRKMLVGTNLGFGTSDNYIYGDRHSTTNRCEHIVLHIVRRLQSTSEVSLLSQLDILLVVLEA